MILNDDDSILPTELARNGERMAVHFGYVEARGNVRGGEVRHVVTTPLITVHRHPGTHAPTVWRRSGFCGGSPTATGGFDIHTAYHGFGVNWPNSVGTSIEDHHSLDSYSVSDYNDMVLTRS